MENEGKVCGNCHSNRPHDGNYCGCFHHKIIPTLVALIGLVFLLGALNAVDGAFVAISWPILLILIGLTKLSVGKCGCYKK